jgi:hypothetical protein
LQQAGWPNRGLSCRVAGRAHETVFIGAGTGTAGAGKLKQVFRIFGSRKGIVDAADGDRV